MKGKPTLPKGKPTVQFGRELIRYLGGDPTPIEDNWCWEDFARHYLELRPLLERFLEECRGGNIAMWTASLCIYCGSDSSWAEEQIERGIGDVTSAHYFLCTGIDPTNERAEAIGVGWNI